MPTPENVLFSSYGPLKLGKILIFLEFQENRVFLKAPTRESALFLVLKFALKVSTNLVLTLRGGFLD